VPAAPLQEAWWSAREPLLIRRLLSYDNYYMYMYIMCIHDYELCYIMCIHD